MGESNCIGTLARIKDRLLLELEAQTLESITKSLLLKMKKGSVDRLPVEQQVELILELQSARSEWSNLSSTLVLRVATLLNNPCRRTQPSMARFCAALCAKNLDHFRHFHFILCLFRLLATDQLDSAKAAIQQWPQGLDSLPDDIAQAFRCRATNQPDNGILHKLNVESNLTTLMLSICTLDQNQLSQHMMGPLLQRVQNFRLDPDGAKWALRTLGLAARIRGLHQSESFFAMAIQPIVFTSRDSKLGKEAFSSANLALGLTKFRSLRTSFFRLDPLLAGHVNGIMETHMEMNADTVLWKYLGILNVPETEQSNIQSKPAVEQKPAKRKAPPSVDCPNKNLMPIKCDLPLEQHKKPKIFKVSPEQTVKNLLMRLSSDSIAQELEEVCTKIEQIKGELHPEDLSRVFVTFFLESDNEEKFTEWTLLTLVLMLRSSGWPDLANLMLPLAISTLSTCSLRKKAEALARTCGRLCPYTERPGGQTFVLVAKLLVSRGQFDLPLVYQALQNLPYNLRVELLGKRPIVCSSLRRLISSAPKEWAFESQMISIFLQPFSGAYPRPDIAALREGIERDDFDLCEEIQLELAMVALEEGSDWAEDNIINNLLAPLSRRPESAAWAINTATLIEKAASGLPKLSAAVAKLLSCSTKE